MIDHAMSLTDRLDLKGLVSFDFLITKNEPLLLEINPRPTAALDIQDDQNGSLFKAHLAACNDEDATAIANTALQSQNAAAIGYLYADQGPVCVPKLAWPQWAMDRPQVGTHIAKGQPLASAIARASSSADAMTRCHNHLGHLQDLLYGLSQQEHHTT